MKEPTIALILCMLITISGVAQKRRSDSEYNELIGPVRNVRTEIAKIEMKAGQMTEREKSFSESLTYDEKGNLIEETDRSSIDGSLNKKIYEHDVNGNYIEVFYAAHKIRFLINKSGRLVPTDGTLHTKWHFKQDGEGNRIEEIGDREDGGRIKIISKYEKGRVIEKLRYSDDQMLYHRVYIRDNAGDIIEQIEYKPDGTISSRESYVYEFDSRGNWIKRITSKWDTKRGKSYFGPKEARYRMIEYY